MPGHNSGLRCYSDLEELPEKEELEALTLSIPSKLLGATVSKAIEHKTHIFCEKPFVLDIQERQQILELAESAELVTLYSHHYRFVSTFQDTARIVGSDALARVQHVRTSAYRPLVLLQKGMTLSPVSS